MRNPCENKPKKMGGSAMRFTDLVHVFLHEGNTVVEGHLVLSEQVCQVYLWQFNTKQARVEHVRSCGFSSQLKAVTTKKYGERTCNSREKRKPLRNCRRRQRPTPRAQDAPTTDDHPLMIGSLRQPSPSTPSPTWPKASNPSTYRKHCRRLTPLQVHRGSQYIRFSRAKAKAQPNQRGACHSTYQ